jgi:cytochrome c biogenesis protein CcmG, thiol:disulfide interchange protein DsbE
MSEVSPASTQSAATDSAANKTPSRGKRAWAFFLPLAVFAVLVGFFYKGLSLDPRIVPSALIGQPAPAFSLPLLHQPEQRFSPADLKGQVWLMNVWGSWCASCRIEHPFLNALAQQQVVPIVGFNWKDAPDAAKAWLKKYQDPYRLSVTDFDGRVAIDWGVYGAPETFVIDKTGTIRYKHTGPIDPVVLEQTLLPLIRELQR